MAWTSLWSWHLWTPKCLSTGVHPTGYQRWMLWCFLELCWAKFRVINGPCPQSLTILKYGRWHCVYYYSPPPWEEYTPLPTGAGLGYVTCSGMENMCGSQCHSEPRPWGLGIFAADTQEKTVLQESSEDETHMSRPQLSLWPGQTNRYTLMRNNAYIISQMPVITEILLF